MNKISFLFIPVLILFGSVQAADVDVYLNGAILGQSCNINTQDLTKNINFPDIDPREFTNIGTYTESQELKINLRSCTGNVTKLSYMLSGDPDDNDPKIFKIKGGGSSENVALATGLGIEVLNANKVAILPNTKTALNSTITTTTYDLPFYLRYKSTLPEVTSGDASSILYLDIYYD